MILVRNVFQLKWGKADEALALTEQFRATSESQGVKGLRLLTDLGGRCSRWCRRWRSRA